MMKFIYLALCFALVAFIPTSFAAQCGATCQEQQVKGYFAALDKVSKKGSNVADIDDLLSLMHASVQYIHVEYEANFDKSSWRKAFLRNLKRGAYKKTKDNEIRVLRAIPGKGHVAIEYSHGVIDKAGVWQQAQARLVLFGFTEGKISLIKEYW